MGVVIKKRVSQDKANMSTEPLAMCITNGFLILKCINMILLLRKGDTENVGQ